MSCERSCFNCRHAKKYSDTPGGRYEPPEPPGAECTLDYAEIEKVFQIADGASDFYVVMAVHCGHYDPELVEVCAQCGEEIGEPVWSWEWWAVGWARKAVCSEVCQKAYRETFAKSVRAWA